MTRNDWENIKEEEFKILFKHSPIKRTKYEGLLRNIAHNKKRQ
jgi:epoxyqueuosine reductase